MDPAGATYRLFRTAILGEKQVVCVYDGFRRELCPLILGHTKGAERVLAFQFAGASRTTLPPGGDWKCLTLAKVREPVLRDGPRFEGDAHAREQRCVEVVDLDVNIHVRHQRPG